MYYYFITFLLLLSSLHSQDHTAILKEIIKNNKDIIAYKEYLNSVNIEGRINNFPLNPELIYSFLTSKEIANGNKQEIIISQSFEFPSKYYLKSKIADLQVSTNNQKLKIFIKEILKRSKSSLLDLVYQRKRIDELSKRFETSNSMLNAIQTKFDKGSIGILELNKAKSSFAVEGSNLNMAKIELSSIISELIYLNGGEQLNPEFTDYWEYEIAPDFDSIWMLAKKTDFRFQSYETELKYYDRKLSLAKSGWLPDFGIAYRQEDELGINYKGIQLQMSLPIFNNINKTPMAESELKTIELNRQAYESQYYIIIKKLFDKTIELEKLYMKQKSLIDFSQLELNIKSYDSGYISLTQYYIDNMIYYDLFDKMLEVEKQYYKTKGELFLEINLLKYF